MFQYKRFIQLHQSLSLPNQGTCFQGTNLTIDFSGILLFPEKEAKSVCPASQEITGCPNLGEADLGVWPHGINWCSGILLFQKKKQKALLFCFAECLIKKFSFFKACLDP
jgi:hypothetical protein